MIDTEIIIDNVYINGCLWEGLKAIRPQKQYQKAHPAPRSWFLDVIFQQKESTLLGKMSDSSLESREKQDEPEAFEVMERKEMKF